MGTPLLMMLPTVSLTSNPTMLLTILTNNPTMLLMILTNNPTMPLMILTSNPMVLLTILISNPMKLLMSSLMNRPLMTHSSHTTLTNNPTRTLTNNPTRTLTNNLTATRTLTPIKATASPTSNSLKIASEDSEVPTIDLIQKNNSLNKIRGKTPDIQGALFS